MTLEQRIFALLDNSPVCDDEELFIDLTRLLPEFAGNEEAIRQAYRAWSETKRAQKVERFD